MWASNPGTARVVRKSPLRSSSPKLRLGLAVHKRACGTCEPKLPIIDNQKIRPPRHDRPELIPFFASRIPDLFRFMCEKCAKSVRLTQWSQVAARLIVR